MLCIFDHTWKRVTASASMYCTISTFEKNHQSSSTLGLHVELEEVTHFQINGILSIVMNHTGVPNHQRQKFWGGLTAAEGHSQTWDFKGNPRNRRTLRSQLTRASRVVEANVRCSERKGLLSVTWLPDHQKYKYISTSWPLNTDYQQKKKGEAFLFTTFLPNLPLDLIGS